MNYKALRRAEGLHIASRRSDHYHAAPNRGGLGFDHRHVDQVLAQEPHLQFIGAQHFADDQVIRAVIAELWPGSNKISPSSTLRIRPDSNLGGLPVASFYFLHSHDLLDVRNLL
jgi:hypothetical protein